MSYLGLSLDVPSSLSATQVIQVRRTLRYDVVGMGAAEHVGQSGGRHLLGQHQNQHLAFKFDVDGDGKRDFAVYEPPVTSAGTGQFQIFLSSRNFSSLFADKMTVSFGNLGDIPVVADFDGDGREDVGVRGRSPIDARIGRWTWCPTPTVPSSGSVISCSSTVSKDSGQSTDVPLPNHRFSSAGGTGFLTSYRPSNCTFYWDAAYGATTGSVAMGGTCNRQQMPVPGLYDDDTLTDLANFDPQTAQFKIIPSLAGYQTNQTITRSFSSVFIAGTTGSPYSRSGSVPLMGLYRSYRDYYLGAHGPWVNRLGFGLWQPTSGRIDVMWNPAMSSTVDFSCPFGGINLSIPFVGQTAQIPFGAFGTNFSSPSSGTACSQPAIYTPRKATDNSLNDTMSVINSPNCTCFTTVTSHTNITSTSMTPRQVFLPVSDIDGDGLADILRYNQESGQAYYLKSSTSFATEINITTIGSARAELL